MVFLYIEDAAYSDLDEIYLHDENEAAYIEVSLEELYDNPELYEHLNEKGFRNIDKPSFDVDWYAAFQRERLNLYRLKIWYPDGALSNYRVIYAHDARHDCFHVLAVMARSLDYDAQHPICQRIRLDYERLGIPNY